MKTKWSALVVSAFLLACTTVSADDGEKTLKEMTGGNTDNQLTVLPEVIGHNVSDAEHAFIDMMKFYVPSQAASGLIGLVDYNNVDLLDVEDLGYAKPLVSVFVYGPTVPVDDTAFAHSFMDTFAGISLDDGVTWKTTNLSQSAGLSSFTLGVDGGGGGDDVTEVPADHNQLEKDDGIIAFHARGMDYPYTNECTDCHGPTLEGGHHSEPSCYSCHGPEWKEDAPDGITVVYIEKAVWKDNKKLVVEGAVEGADSRTFVTLINGVTDAVLDTEYTEKNGEFEFKLKLTAPPCTVAVLADGVQSNVISVSQKKDSDSDSDDDSDGDSDDDSDGDSDDDSDSDVNTSEVLEGCVGEPTNLAIYPGGAYNVFHATAGNKVLVAWPSRYCKQGQPAYSIAWDGDDEGLSLDQLNKRQALESFLDIDVTQDLYLTDLFEVAGSQGSIDFADEGYPQAGEVPHGCVWTARGVLLPGDDPRTAEARSHAHGLDEARTADIRPSRPQPHRSQGCAGGRLRHYLAGRPRWAASRPGRRPG